MYVISRVSHRETISCAALFLCHAAVKETEKPAKGAKPVKPEAKTNNITEAGRSGSKQSTLIALLGRSVGATAEEMTKATGWQNHSVLGTISGMLKKRLKLTVASTKEERRRVYRIGSVH